MLQQRNTPGTSGSSPAKIVLGRPLRDDLPIHPSQFDSTIRSQNTHRLDDVTHRGVPPLSRDHRIETCSQDVKRHYDQHVPDLPEFAVGARVRVQDVRKRRWDKFGVIVQVGPYQRYLARYDSRKVKRNRSHLRKRFTVIPVAVDIGKEEKALLRSPPGAGGRWS